MPHKILLCDDDIHILRASEFKFKRAGFDVTCAHDGQEAYELIQQQRPDAVVTDCQMPRMNGLQLVEALRNNPETVDLPVILLTAKGFELKTAELIQKWGIAAILTKPFSPRELLGYVQQMIETGSCVVSEPVI